MVRGINQFSQLQFALDAKKSRENQNVYEGQDSLDLRELQYSQKLDFSLNYAKSMQVVENGAKREMSQSLSLEFNISVEANGRLRSQAQVPGGEAEKTSSELEDLFGPEATAGRIVDFVKSAFEFTKLYGENKLETDEDRLKFQESQTDAVKKGFEQAKKLLGKLPEDVESGIGKTFDLVLEGLEKFFNGDEEEVSEETAPTPENGQYYSSQSFSLSYQLEVNAQGNFDPEELQAFIDDSLSQVQDVFADFLGGGKQGEETGFNPFGLFQLDQLNLDKVKGLLSE